MPPIKRWGNDRMTNLISRLCRRKFTDVSCGFRAYSRETLLKINFHGRYTYTQESFISFCFDGLAIREVPIDVTYFPERKSRVAGSIPKYLKKTSGIIVGLMRDYYPMRFFGSIGGVFLIPALVLSEGRLLQRLSVCRADFSFLSADLRADALLRRGHGEHGARQPQRKPHPVRAAQKCAHSA